MPGSSVEILINKSLELLERLMRQFLELRGDEVIDCMMSITEQEFERLLNEKDLTEAALQRLEAQGIDETLRPRLAALYVKAIRSTLSLRSCSDCKTRL